MVCKFCGNTEVNRDGVTYRIVCAECRPPNDKPAVRKRPKFYKALPYAILCVLSDVLRSISNRAYNAARAATRAASRVMSDD